jgi:hypothetical protein
MKRKLVSFLNCLLYTNIAPESLECVQVFCWERIFGSKIIVNENERDVLLEEQVQLAHV